jgi:protein-tyrosine phosphatase
MISRVLLSIARVEPEAIVDDYLETVRLGDVRAASANRNNDEALIEGLLAGYGTTTEQAFRDALAGLDLAALWRAAGVNDDARHLLETWRGRLPVRSGS